MSPFASTARRRLMSPFCTETPFISSRLNAINDCARSLIASPDARSFARRSASPFLLPACTFSIKDMSEAPLTVSIVSKANSRLLLSQQSKGRGVARVACEHAKQIVNCLRRLRNRSCRLRERPSVRPSVSRVYFWRRLYPAKNEWLSSRRRQRRTQKGVASYPERPSFSTQKLGQRCGHRRILV